MLKIITTVLFVAFVIFLIITQVKVFRIMKKYGLFSASRKDIEANDRILLSKIQGLRILFFVLLAIIFIVLFFIYRT